MDVVFLNTVVRKDQTSYVDLIEIDGKLFTFLMKKSEEPNVYSVAEYTEGNHLEEMLKG